MRRCVGCGRVTPRGALVRVALDARAPQPRAVLDPELCRPGRGAYLCRADRAALPAPDCLARALRRRVLPRALRAPAGLVLDFVESNA